MIKILNIRERIIFYLAVVIIGFGIVLNFFLVPIVKKYDALGQQIKYNLAKLIKYQQLLAQGNKIEAKLNQLSTGLPDLNKGQKNSLMSALAGLEDLARSSGVNIIDIRPQQQASGSKSFKELIIDLKIEGTMEGITKFLYNLENSLYLLRVKKMQLSAKPSSQNLEANFSISQFLLTE